MQLSSQAEELLAIAARQDGLADSFCAPEIEAPLQALQTAAEKTQKAFCGSWLGHHARVYYKDLNSPPAGGLGPIRFPKGNTKAVLQEIREVPEREWLVA